LNIFSTSHLPTQANSNEIIGGTTAVFEESDSDQTG